MANNDWILRPLTSVSQQFVYTQNSVGMITLWDKGNTNATSIAPGFAGSPWSRLDYDTGIDYVYIANSAGLRTFWFSPTRSTLYPGRGTPDPANPPHTLQWRLLYEREFEEQSFVIRVDGDGGMIYFDTDITSEDGWRELSSASLGNGSQIIYHWRETNFYRHGDIVVYGTTATNTHRYFRLNLALGQTMVGTRPMNDPAWVEIRAHEL